MKTNKTLKERNEIINRVLLESITSDDVLFKSDEEKVLYAFNRFKSEYGFRVKQIGLFKACTEWLQGLALGIPFYNVDILKLMETLGYLNLSPKEEDKVLSTYFEFMANKFLILCKHYKVNIYEVI